MGVVAMYRVESVRIEFFLVGVFLYSNKGKYGPGKTLYLDTFHALMFSQLVATLRSNSTI